MQELITTALVPFITEGLKRLLKVSPDSKKIMKALAAIVSGIAVLLSLAGDENARGIAENLIMWALIFFTQDGLYNTLLKPLFDRIKKKDG